MRFTGEIYSTWFTAEPRTHDPSPSRTNPSKQAHTYEFNGKIFSKDPRDALFVTDFTSFEQCVLFAYKIMPSLVPLLPGHGFSLNVYIADEGTRTYVLSHSEIEDFVHQDLEKKAIKEVLRYQDYLRKRKESYNSQKRDPFTETK